MSVTVYLDSLVTQVFAGTMNNVFCKRSHKEKRIVFSVQ